MEQNVTAQFKDYFPDSEQTTKAIEIVRLEAEKMVEAPEEEDETDDAEELCNCQIT